MINLFFPISLFTFTISLFGCQESIEKTKTTEELYAEKSAEIINEYILKSTDCTCILESTSNSFLDEIKEEQPARNVDDYIRKLMRDLNIEDRSTFDKMNALTETFDIKNLIQNSTIKILNNTKTAKVYSIESLEKWRAYTYSKCPKGFCIIDKPIFNENFNRATFNSSLGYTCLRTDPMILIFTDGQWFHSNQL